MVSLALTARNGGGVRQPSAANGAKPAHLIHRVFASALLHCRERQAVRPPRARTIGGCVSRPAPGAVRRPPRGGGVWGRRPPPPPRARAGGATAIGTGG